MSVLLYCTQSSYPTGSAPLGILLLGNAHRIAASLSFPPSAPPRCAPIISGNHASASGVGESAVPSVAPTESPTVRPTIAPTIEIIYRTDAPTLAPTSVSAAPNLRPQVQTALVNDFCFCTLLYVRWCSGALYVIAH